MWWTPLGERVLRGAEWELFRDGLSMVRDLVEESKSSDDPEICFVGVEAFDQLQANQKLALLALVGKALKDEGEPMPELTAHTEAAVAAVYAHIFAMIVVEIEYPPESQEDVGDPLNVADGFAWRRLALAAYLEDDGPPEAISPAGPNEGDDRVPGDRDEDDGVWSPPEASSEDVDEWEFLVVECLANRILWADGDHESGPAFLDSDPAVSRYFMNALGIAENYYTAVAPDPTDEQLDSVRRTLRDVCGGLEGLA
jgi:hypothetical protein